MERRLESAAVAALAVVVVGVAAATLGETTSSGAIGVGGGSSGGVGGGGSFVPAPLSATGDPLPALTLLGLVTAVLLLVGVVLFPRHALRQAGVAAAISAVLIGLLWLLYRALDPSVRQPAGGPRNASAPLGVGTAGGQGIGGGGASLPEPVLLGVVVAALLGLGVVGLLLREAPTPGDVDGEGAAGATLSAIGRSAGRAADRIEESESADLDNEVYRAWKEMTGHLDVDDPDARTAGEFREAALDAGMATGDVDALTELFEEVRYGGAPATGDRERAAADALRRIEERYAAEGEA